MKTLSLDFCYEGLTVKEFMTLLNDLCKNHKTEIIKFNPVGPSGWPEITFKGSESDLINLEKIWDQNADE